MSAEGPALSALRILMVCEDLPAPAAGGLGKHVLLLAKALAAAGHQVDLMGNAECRPETLKEPMDLPGRFFGELAGSQQGWKEVALGCFNPLKRAVIARRFARAVMRRAAGYDVIHYHGHVPDLAAFIPSHVNFVQTRHDQGSDCLRHTRFKNGQVCNETRPAACATCAHAAPNALQRAASTLSVVQFRKRVAQGFSQHKTVFVSDMLRRNLARTLGAPPERWGTVVHNFVDWATLQPYWQATPVPATPRTVFVAGKLYPPKGIADFLAACSPRLSGGMQIVVAGDGPQEAALRERFAGAPVRLLGWCSYPDVLSHTARADTVVVPSLCEESCATTVLEALALGRAVFALNRGGTPELIRYQRYAGQLHLFPSLPALVDGLLVPVDETQAVPVPLDYADDISARLPELLAVYRAPSPSLSHT